MNTILTYDQLVCELARLRQVDPRPIVTVDGPNDMGICGVLARSNPLATKPFDPTLPGRPTS
jgi:hypothetical protein